MTEPRTIGELCRMLVNTGECQDYEVICDKRHKDVLFSCIENCKKLDGYIAKYWGEDKEHDERRTKGTM